MSNRILTVTDNVQQSLEHSKAIAERFRSDLIDPSGLAKSDSGTVLLLIIHVDLGNKENIELLKEHLTGPYKSHPKIFLIEGNNRSQAVQANSLGACSIFELPLDNTGKLLALIEKYLNKATESFWDARPKKEKAALNGVTALNDKIYDAIRLAQALPKEQVHKCSDLIIENFEENSVSSWLDAVKAHHNQTYRHSMNVAGLAVAFGLHLGMRHSDVQRLAISALLHDVGMVRIPLSILNKTEEISLEERKTYRQHPIYSGEILTKDGQFDFEVIDVAIHHHEYLDGSGYPHGLLLNQIFDLLRVVTILDTFCELIDPRFSTSAVSKKEAFTIMEGMQGKLDMDFVKAFAPIALG